jgi:hypothetical protein
MAVPQYVISSGSRQIWRCSGRALSCVGPARERAQREGGVGERREKREGGAAHCFNT